METSDFVIRLGDCLEAMAELDDASIDAVVTDPPYGISFMGKHWDGKAIEERVGKRDRLGERLTGDLDGRSKRKLTARTASAFANRAGAAGDYDTSLTGNRAFQAWVEEWGSELLRVLKPGGHAAVFGGTRTSHRLAAGLEDAGLEIRDTLCWLFGQGFPKSRDLGDGWGTALKPAHEPIVLARKPVIGTATQNFSEHGVGGLNVDGCRIAVADAEYARNASGDRGHEGTRSIENRGATDLRPGGGSASDGGRWPANVVIDEEAAELLDEQSGELVSGANPTRRGSDKFRDIYGDFKGQEECEPARGVDVGGASRFFYCAKVNRAERNAGVDGCNVHPTVKPLAIMRWLCRLVTPPDGLILDPFAGSGSTGCAAVLEGFRFVGIEREDDYARIAEARIAYWASRGTQLDLIEEVA